MLLCVCPAALLQKRANNLPLWEGATDEQVAKTIPVYNDVFQVGGWVGCCGLGWSDPLEPMLMPCMPCCMHLLLQAVFHECTDFHE